MEHSQNDAQRGFNPGRAAFAIMLAFGTLLSGCGPQKPVEDVANAEPEPAPIGLVSASVVVDSCPDAGKMNSRSANAAIRKLVEPCSAVPGGAAHFSATFVPGGQIALASPEGDPAAGVVPTCVLKNRLTHQVLLRRPCTFDVFLEERNLEGASAPPSSSAPPPSPAPP